VTLAQIKEAAGRIRSLCSGRSLPAASFGAPVLGSDQSTCPADENYILISRPSCPTNGAHCTGKPDKYGRYLADAFITHPGGETYLNNPLLAHAHATVKREWEFGDWIQEFSKRGIAQETRLLIHGCATP
jgi:hypothetical protein